MTACPRRPAHASPRCAASTASTRGRSACCARTISTAPTRSAKCACSTKSRSGGAPTASDIGRALDLDAGYLSRVLRNFEKRGLIARTTSEEDARQSHLTLTARGRKAFAPLEKRSQDARRRHARQARRRRAGAAGRGDERRSRRCSAAKPPRRARYMLRAPQPRRLRLDRHPPCRALRAGIWLGRARSRACARRSSPTSSTTTTQARALLDRRDGRRECRLRHAGEGQAGRRPHPPAAGRSEGARARARRAAGRRMRALRARGRLQEDHAVDAQRAHRRAPHL